MRKFLHEKIKFLKNSTIWLIDKTNLDFFYRRRVRDKLKLLENFKNQKIINFKNKLTTSNYKKMENLLKQINRKRKNISQLFREVKKIKRAQVLVSLVLIFSLVSFFYNPKLVEAAGTVNITYSTSPAKTGVVTITATYSKAVPQTPNISINQPGSIDISNQPMTGSGTTWTYDYTVNSANGSTYIDGTTTVTLSNEFTPAVSATGGTITYTDSSGLNPRSSPAYSGGYTVHTFITGGTFSVVSAGIVDALIVAGGGGGGYYNGGGGGAGGVIYNTSYSTTTGNITITVGTGGDGGVSGNNTSAYGKNGGNSVFASLTAYGGGGGDNAYYGLGAGNAGGSGGGGNGGGSGETGQGYRGGNFAGGAVNGGGGGAGGIGGQSNGGTGISNSILGSSNDYAGGGGGGQLGSGSYGGGSGGGQAKTLATAGTDGTGGGGGGGGGGYDPYAIGRKGGSGIVIVRYPTDAQTFNASNNTFSIDTTSPALSGATIASVTADTTPDFTFTSSEAGTISYGGSCSSAITSAISGSNTVTFNTLTNGTYSNCTVTVTDVATNASTALSVPTFLVDSTALILSSGTHAYNAYTWSNYANVYIIGAASFQGGANAFNFGAANLSIKSGGSLITLPSATTGSGAVGVTISTTGNITIDSGGSINGAGRGYAGGATSSSGKGEGAGAYGQWEGSNGASHGGTGGKGISNGAVAATYGSSTSPVTLGSGGGGYGNGSGGAGGGAIKLSTSGIVTVNGTISTNGSNGSGGGGAGGSVWIVAGTLIGSNDAIISANGGTGGGYNGGGGAGRIKLETTGVDTYAGSVKVEGSRGLTAGNSGSIERTVGTPGTITIAAGKTVIWTKGDHTFNNVIIESTGVLSGGLAEAGGTGASYMSYYYGGGTGPGRSGFDSSGGAGHGGVGASGNTSHSSYGAGGSTYDSATAPALTGSGGGGGDGGIYGGSGGGAIKLTITGTLTNNGSILANATAGTGGGGGSGGSVWINAPGATVTGAGVYSATGSSSSNGGGGGGGRISFTAGTNLNFSGTPTITVTAGSSGSGSPTAGVGTVYGIMYSGVTSPTAGQTLKTLSTVTGTSGDYSGGTITGVKVSINKGGLCWGGSSFNQACPYFTSNSATNTGTNFSTWSFAFPSFTSSLAGDSITIQSQATSSTSGTEAVGAGVAFTFDNVAPTNQDTVFSTNTERQSGANVTVTSAAETGGAIWFAPNGTSTFSAGATMTTASGTATLIAAPATVGAYRLYIIDAAGNVSSASTAILTVDNTAPTITSTTPTTNAYISTSTVSYTLTEANTVASGSVTWTRTGGTADAGSPHIQALTGAELNIGAHANITLTNNPTLVDGTIYAITFDATDNSGNAATQVSSTGVTYDTIPPGVTLSTTVVGGLTNLPIPVTVTFTEDVTGFDSTDITLGSGTVSSFSGTGSVYTFTANPTSQGTETINIAGSKAVDLAGNNNTAATQLSITYDTQAPTVTYPTNVAQRLMSTNTSTSTVALDEAGIIYLVKNGTGSLTAQADSANLTGLVISGSPSGYTFSGGTYIYNGVTTGSSSVTVTPTGAGTITVNGTVVASGVASSAIDLSGGTEQTVTVTVVETNKNLKTYVVKILKVLSSTGGNFVTESGGYRTHVFTSSGTFTSSGSLTGEVFLVGGGGGAAIYSGRGGNGGQVIDNASASISSGSTTVTVGSNGLGAANWPAPWNGPAGQNGSSSYFGALVATGGTGGSSACCQRGGDGAGGQGGSYNTGTTRGLGGPGVTYNNFSGSPVTYFAAGGNSGDGGAIGGTNTGTGGGAINSSAGGQNGGTGIVIVKIPIGGTQTPMQTIPTLSSTYGTNVSTTISSSGANAIYYTTDGTNPTVSSTLYTGAITTSSARTIKAIAVRTGYDNSPIATISYVVDWNNAINVGHTAFSVANPATATTPYQATLPAGLIDGAYDAVAIDTIGNTSAPLTSWLTVDNTAPTITVTSNATGSGWLKIGDTIVFTITPTTTEADATVNAVTYNGEALTWSTADSGAHYTATYTVIQGQTDQASPLQLTGVTLTDVAGNVSTSAGTSDVAKKIDANLPTNQNSVFPSNFATQGGGTVTINSSGDTTNGVWFAPAGTTTFVEGTTMTKTTNGLATSILAPVTDGIYKLFVIDASGNISSASTVTLTVDAIAPTTSAPINVAQVLKGGAVSTSTVQTNEQGKIYLIKNGVAAATQANLDAAVNTNHNGFVGQTTASGGIAYTVTLPADLVDGVYDIVGVDLVGNISSPLAGWLTVDNTAPTSIVTSPTDNQLVGALTSISGTATDTHSISAQSISIKNTTTNKWYNGTSFTDDTENFLTVTPGATWTYSTSGITWSSNTSYILKTKATDIAGNVETPGAGTTFTIDSIAPVSVITAPIDASFKNAVTSISGTATDTGTVSLSEISIERLSDHQWYSSGSFSSGTEVFLAATGTTAWSYAITSDKFTTNTEYKIKSRSTDDASNVETPGAGITFTFDTTLPTSTITAICSVGGNGCTTVGQASSPQESFSVQSIAGTTTDTAGGAGVASVEVSIKDTTTNKWYSGASFVDSTETYLPAVGTDTWSYNSSAMSLVIGHIYLIHAKSIDNATNVQSPVQALSFQFTNSPPTVSAVTASQDSNGVVNITYNVTDNESSQTTNYLFYGVWATLSGTTTSGATSFTLSDATNFPASGTILIDDEIITYTSKSGNILQGLTRGASGTTPFAHTDGEVYIKANSATGSGIGLSDKGTGKIITWQASTDADGYESTSEVIKVVANDGATGSMIGSAPSPQFILDAAKPTLTVTTFLINDTDADVVATSPNVVFKLQNVVGHPANENIHIKFSKDSGTTWYGANADHSLTLGGAGSEFSSDPAVLSTLYWNFTMASRSEIWIVKMTDSSSNVSTTDDNTVGYNAKPEFDASFGTDGLSVSQISDKLDLNWGKVKIDYKVRDTDNTSATPTFSFDGTGGTNFTTINQAEISGISTDITSTYTLHTVYWTPVAESVSTLNASFKVEINDGEPVANTASKTISSIIVDAKKPVVGTTVTFDAGVAGVAESAIITIPKPTDDSAIQYRIQDNVSNSPVVDTGWVNLLSSTTIPWTFDSDSEIKTIKYEFRDAYGNITSETSTSTLAPITSGTFLIQDTSNINVSPMVSQLYISWQQLDAPATGFSSYKLEYAYSTNGSSYSNYADVPDPLNLLSNYSTNYYIHKDLTSTYFYKYRLGVKGTNQNISMRVGESVIAKPDGSPNYGEGAGASINSSTVESVVPIQNATTKNVTVTYKLTDATNDKKTSPAYDARIFYDIGVTLGTNPYNGTTLKVSSTSKLKSSGYIQINNEVIKYTGKTDTTLTGLTRATWPTEDTRATRSNGVSFLAGTPVWVMASNTTPTNISAIPVDNTTIKSGYNGTIAWDTYYESALAGSTYSVVPIRVLVHDNQDALSGPLSSQSDYSENGTLSDFDLSAPTISFNGSTSSGLESVTPATFTINLSRAYPINSTVHYVVTGTALGSGGNADYSGLASSGDITFTAGDTQKTLIATIINHSLVRANKTIIVTLSSPTNSTLGTNPVYTYTILNHGADTTPPVVTLSGDASMHVLSGTTFSDPGATAIDDVDGDITSNIVVTGLPIMNTPSATPYVVTYSSTDSSNNIGTANRDVYVDDANAATFDITATSGANGTVTPDGVTNVLVHSNKTYTITPSDGYKVATITVDSDSVTPTVGINHYTFTNITGPHSITATFSALPDTTKPTITLIGLATVPITVGDTYIDAGATASDTYLGVTTDLTSSIEVVSSVNTSVSGTYKVKYTVADAAGNVATATRTVNVSLNATYTITATAGAHGAISPIGATSITTGHDSTFTITPDAGYQTATLTIDGVGRAVASSYTFTNVVADHTIAATFSAAADTTKPTITIIGPTTVPLTVGDTYTDQGATASDTYLGVTTDLTSSIITTGIPISPVTAGTYLVMYTVSDSAGNTQTATRTVNVTYNTTYSITASAGAHGTISPSGVVSVLKGANRIFTITPDSGYVVATLTIDGVGVAISSSHTFFNVVADHAIAATFSNAIDTTPPVITLNGDATMSVTKDSEITFTDPGATALDAVDGVVTVTATGTVNMSAIGSYTITYRASDNSGNTAVATRTVNVGYASTYTITASAGSNGTISPVGAVSVNVHADQIFTITPDAGFGVDTLTVDGVKIASATTHTFSGVIASHTINVTFTAAPDTTAPVITLSGNNPMNVIVGSTFTDPGATATDDRDGTLTSSIVTTGTVNANAVGTYTLTYSVSDVAKNKATLTRTVIVKYADTYNITVTSGAHGTISPATGSVTSQQDHTYTITPDTNYKISSLLVDGVSLATTGTYTFTNVIAPHAIAATFSLIDALPPIITLNHPELNPMSINTGSVFVDPGATAVAEVTGETLIVSATGTVDTSTASTGNIITYSATDAAGTTGTATRTVNVTDITPPKITDIAVPVITTTGAAITWTTDEPATSQVFYGTVSGTLDRTTILDTSKSIYHMVILNSSTNDTLGIPNTLTINTKYYFTVSSIDASNNISLPQSEESTFSTIPSVTKVITIDNTHTTNNPANPNVSMFIPDTTAPVISDVKIYDISAFEASVSFTTDEDTLTFAEYGRTTKYDDNSANNAWGKEHIIKIRGLKFGTDYHVKITAVDKAGNSSATEDKVFKTKFFSENPSDLTKLDNVEQFQNEIETTIESILPALIPPFIEKPKIIDITENSATVTYRTNIKAFPVVGYIEDSSYDATKKNPYLIETSDTTEKSFDHTLKLLNLRSNTLYHLQARAFSLPQVVGKSEEVTFTTQASKIHGSITQKKKDSFTIVWTTDEPTSSIVEYKNLKSGEVSRIIDNTNKSTSHSIKVENLTPGTSYEVKISGLNEKGNVFEGDAPITVTTLVDVTPPAISNFKVESSLVTGRTDRAQSIISWKTDEPSTSIVYFEEGSGSPDKPLLNKQEDTTTLVTNHVVILSTLKPGTIYRIQIASVDDAGNRIKTPIRTMITPRLNESIVDVIFKNFDQTFNFLKNVK